MNLNNSSITFFPSSALDLNTEYYVLIDSTAIVSVVGVEYPGISVKADWSFTTVSDATPPSLSGTSPADEASGVALGTDLVATFAEDIDAMMGAVEVTLAP